MSAARRLAGAALALGVAGCGAHATSQTQSSATASSFSASRVLVVPRLGALSWRCSGASFSTRWSARVATESVTPPGAAAARTLQPGQALAAPASTATIRWRIVQSTEPQSLVAVVAVGPGVCPSGLPAVCLSLRAIPHTSPGWQAELARRTRCG